MPITPEWAARVKQALHHADTLEINPAAMTPAWYVHTVLGHLGVDLTKPLSECAVPDPAGLVKFIVAYARNKQSDSGLDDNEISTNFVSQIQPLNEAMLLKGWDEYRELVAAAYEAAPSQDPAVVKHWQALNQSNHLLFKRLLSKVHIVFVTGEATQGGQTLTVQGRPYQLEFLDGGQPYDTQPEMRAAYRSTGILRISIDYSDHPIFSVEDNIIFRTVHDFIVHILGNHPFGAKGEIASYNLHSKLAPREALPALFTEVVGQACYAVTNGGFPEQKIAVLPGFDYLQVGKVEGHEIVDKQLTRDGVPLQAKTQSHDQGEDTASVGVTGAAKEVGEPSLIQERDDLGKAGRVRQLVDAYPAYLVNAARALVEKYTAAPAGADFYQQLATLTHYQGVRIELAQPPEPGDQGQYDVGTQTVSIYDEAIGRQLADFRYRLGVLARSHADAAKTGAARKAALKACDALARANWSGFRNTFYHELVHQQDDQRGQMGPSFTNMRKQIDDRPDGAKRMNRHYYNSPHETNARFVTRVAEMTAAAEQPGYQLPATAQAFVQAFTNDDEFYFGHLTGVNKKATLKRIYDLYQQLKAAQGSAVLQEGPVPTMLGLLDMDALKPLEEASSLDAYYRRKIERVQARQHGRKEPPLLRRPLSENGSATGSFEGCVAITEEQTPPQGAVSQAEMVDEAQQFEGAAIGEDEPGYARAEDLVWALESHYPVSRVTMTADQADFLHDEAFGPDNEGHQDYPLNWYKQGARLGWTPTLAEMDGCGYLWDGNHRVASAIMQGATSFPALVGRPKAQPEALNEGPVSQYRDNKHFAGADIQYPDNIFAGIQDQRQARVAIEFYQKQVAAFNKLFNRRIQLSATAHGADDFRVVTRNENGLQPEYFAYPTATMGQHVVQRFIDKLVPATSLRHELLHEAIVPFITEKFELTNHADQSAAAGSIDDVQRQRAFNYSLEDVFYERVVEHLERLPDFQDTFPMAEFGKDWMARLAQEHGAQPLTPQALQATQQRFLAEDETTNRFLLRVLPALLAQVPLEGVTDLQQLAEPLGRRFEQWFNAQKNIFAQELQAKLAEFGSRFMAFYREAQAKLAPRPAPEPEPELAAPGVA